MLIIHGSEDEAIPSNKDPHELLEIANKPKKLVIIKDSDNSFTKPKHLREVISHVHRFIK